MRSQDLLASFTAYCYAHPKERFWQALRNWCGWRYVYVSNVITDHHEGTKDTFYWEENKKPPTVT